MALLPNGLPYDGQNFFAAIFLCHLIPRDRGIGVNFIQIRLRQLNTGQAGIDELLNDVGGLCLVIFKRESLIVLCLLPDDLLQIFRQGGQRR